MWCSSCDQSGAHIHRWMERLKEAYGFICARKDWEPTDIRLITLRVLYSVPRRHARDLLKFSDMVEEFSVWLIGVRQRAMRVRVRVPLPCVCVSCVLFWRVRGSASLLQNWNDPEFVAHFGGPCLVGALSPAMNGKRSTKNNTARVSACSAGLFD